MSMRRLAAAWTLTTAAAMLAAGCGTGGLAARPPAGQTTLPAPPSLATTLVTSAGSWAVAVMGGSAARHNNFWQLFIRPARSSRWALVTPPGVADNGGLVLAGLGGRSAAIGFRPSQYLTFSPITVTRNGGRAWSSASPLNAALADVPDALAAAPKTGDLLALLAAGTAALAAPGYTKWTVLSSQRTLAATAPGRHCGLRAITAVTFSPSGVPLLAGACRRPGTAGIFAARDGTWQAAAPELPAALARRPVTVLRLARTADRTVALLAAGSGPAASLIAAWSADDGGKWTMSPPLSLHNARPISASFGPEGMTAIVLTGNRGATVAEGGTAWRSLPRLPPGTATLAPDSHGEVDALAVQGTRLTIWSLAAGQSGWRATQTINVPLQFGSS